jgi:hypothetical protein
MGWDARLRVLGFDRQDGTRTLIRELSKKYQSPLRIKFGKFKAAYKGQMELYLRWLEVNEQESSEDSPLGLILGAEGGQESIALLRLHQAGIRVGQYLTELPPKKVLERKLHESIALSRALLEGRAANQNSDRPAPKVGL